MERDGGFRSSNFNSGLSFASGGFRSSNFNSGLSFASGGFKDVLHLRKTVETTLKSPTEQSSTAQAVAEVQVPDNISGNWFFGPFTLVQEIKKGIQILSTNLDRFYDLGIQYLSYIRLGGIFIVASGCFCVGFYTLRRIRSCRGNYCGWVLKVDRFLHAITKWFFHPPNSVETFKALIETHLKKDEFTEAEYVLDRMIDKGYMPSPDLFNGVVASLLEGCNFRLASKVLRSMSELRVVGDAVLTSKVLKSLLSRGQVLEVIQHLELLIEIGAILNLKNLIDYACEEHRSIAAWRLLEFGVVNECPMDVQISFNVLDSLLSTGDALVGYSLMSRGYITVCDRTRLDNLVEMLNLKGYPEQANIIFARFAI